jgi:predicted RNA-binding protein YlqC (UPF0109 family)
MTENKDQQFVEMLAKQLVENPEKVEVKRSVDEMGVLLELTVDKSDMGVIIGKEGKTAKAIRTLLRVLGAKTDARVNLKIVDPAGDSEQREEKPAQPKEEKVEVPEKEVVEVEEDEERPMADLEL